MKFLVTDYAPNLADPDLCTEIDDDFVDDADDAVEKYAEDDDWSDGYSPRTVYVLCVDTGITSEHEITVEFDPIFSSSATRHGPEAPPPPMPPPRPMPPPPPRIISPREFDARKVWAAFDWPSWVPSSVREQLVDFCVFQGRSPEQWLAGDTYNRPPPFGIELAAGGRGMPCIGAFPTTVFGRFVHMWNNMGRLVAEDGTVHVVSFGPNWDRVDVVDLSAVGGGGGGPPPPPRRRGCVMKRTPMSRGSGSGLSRSSPMKRTAPLRQRSKKAERAYAGDAAAGLEGRRDFVARILAARPWCEACALISLYVDGQAGPRRRAVEVHEVLRRSAGGSIVDDDNVLAVSRWAHRWIHNNPKEARELGLLRSRYASTPTTAPETT